MIALLIPAVLVASAVRPQLPTQPPVKAITHVAVIPMEDTNQVLTDQTIVVRDNRIVALGPAAQVVVPRGAMQIDGHGKYVIPGLADMHVHLGVRDFLVKADYQKPPESQRLQTVENDLFLFAANGVTTLRSVNFTADEYDPNQAILRARTLAAAGQIWSPRIYASGEWHQDPKRSVAENLIAYQAVGYDFVKLHENTWDSGPYLDSLLTTAHLLGLPVMGHIGTVGDSLMHALTAHYASIEHLTGYPGMGPDSHLADTVRLPAMIAATQRSGVWNCPTLVANRFLDNPDDWPEARQFHFKSWIGMYYKPLEDFDSLEVARWRATQRLVKALQDAGAGLLLGTDAPMVMPAFSVHHELQALVGAGLTPYQALATGTRNVAAYFGTLHDGGTVAVGKRADLVLLNGNPLDKIENTMHPAGVMLNGHWLAQATIDQQLATLAAAYRAGKLKWPLKWS